MNKLKKALIVEDKKDSQDAITYIFQMLDWEKTTIVSDGKKALQLLMSEENNYDVIILDYGLPHGMNGLKVMEKAKSNVKNLPPVIMVTGAYDPSVESEAQTLGVAAFFLKSDLHKMKELLEKMFG